MLTLPLRLDRAAQRGGQVVFIDGDDGVRVPWAQIHADARVMATALQARDIGPGSHVALLGPTSQGLVTALQGIWMAGATVVVLPLPMRMASIEEFVDQTRARIHQADVRLVIVDPALAGFVTAEPGDPPFVTMTDLAGGPDRLVTPAVDPESLAVLQFTSGSTSDPKGVMIPHRALAANLDAAGQASLYDPDDDVLVSWLPLYHDMGLVGMLLLPMSNGGDLVLAGPQDFMSSPSRWMQWLSDYHGTATAGPNFAWALAARALHRMEGLDLSRLRVGINGAEPIDPAAVESLVDAGRRHGLRPGAVFPAFGMAELTIAGTFPEPMRGLVTDAVDRRVLETERYAAPADPDLPTTRRLAKLGRPVPGLEIRVVDPENGRPRQEREVGELQIRGTSLMAGYYKRPDATAAAFDSEWLRTGDLAYLVDGEMVMCGRIKDVIIVAGRNVFPEDIERAVGSVDGVRAGNVIAFGVDGRRGQEAVVVVAESKAENMGPVRDGVAERVRQAVGLAAKEIVLVAPGSLPKTSSGKLQRSLCRSRYLDEALQPV